MGKTPDHPAKKETRAERLARALRANLKRRKDQAKQRRKQTPSEVASTVKET